MDYKVKLRKRNISNDEILKDLKKVAKSLNRETMSHTEYAKHGQFGVTTIRRKFGTWNKALEEANLKLDQYQNLDKAQLLENLAEVWMKLGRQPTYHDFNKKISICSVGPYERAFKSWNNALIEFSKYIKSGKKLTSYELKTEKSVSRKRTSRTIGYRIRFIVMQRDGFRCKMCGRSPATNRKVILHVDHIHPYSKGGETTIDNLQTLCSKCNLGKSNL